MGWAIAYTPIHLTLTRVVDPHVGRWDPQIEVLQSGPVYSPVQLEGLQPCGVQHPSLLRLHPIREITNQLRLFCGGLCRHNT